MVICFKKNFDQKTHCFTSLSAPNYCHNNDWSPMHRFGHCDEKLWLPMNSFCVVPLQWERLSFPYPSFQIDAVKCHWPYSMFAKVLFWMYANVNSKVLRHISTIFGRHWSSSIYSLKCINHFLLFYPEVRVCHHLLEGCVPGQPPLK